MVVIEERKRVKKIPIFGRRRARFDSRKEADAYALELAKLWIEGKSPAETAAHSGVNPD